MSALHADPHQSSRPAAAVDRRRTDLDRDRVAVFAMLTILGLTALAFLLLSVTGA